MSSAFWFRNDLRLVDNPALVKAAEQGDCVVALYVVSAGMYEEHGAAPSRISFIKQHLDILSTELKKINLPLVILLAKNRLDIPGVVAEFISTNQIESLYFNAEYPLHEFTRDKEVSEILRSRGVKVVRCHDRVMIPPGMIRNGKGEPYKVFTAFKKNWIGQVQRLNLQPLGSPKKQKTLKEFSSVPLESAFADIDQKDLSAIWPAGEKVAIKRLKKFVEDKIHRYREERDFPILEVTSRLSPYLAVGSISVRQCLWAALQANRGEFDSGSEGVVCWISELVWRDFYQHVMVDFPEVCKHKPMQGRTDQIPWKTDRRLLSAWAEGKTGVPIVDAAMRQLLDTGWMHNRLRMVVAMYFTKNLQLDWRLGEDFFMRNLIDGDFAANNGGWQWCASTGTDAAPYFRVFNPVSQSEKFDVTGEFIKKYLPELTHISAKQIHNPDESLGYHRPLVDLSLTRKETIEWFARLK